MVKCTNCKWFIEQTLNDDLGTVYIGICTAIPENEYLMTKSEVLNNAPCDFYVNNSNDDTTEES